MNNEEKILAMLEQMNGRFDGMDKRFDGIDARLDGIDGRLDGIDGRLDKLDIRVASLETDVREIKHVVGVNKDNIVRIWGHLMGRQPRIVPLGDDLKEM